MVQFLMSYLCVCFYYSNIIKVYLCGRSSDGVARTQLTGHLPIIGLFISFPFNPPISCLSLTCLIQSTNQLPLFDLCHSIHQSAASFCLLPFNQPISCLFFTCVIQSTNQLTLFYCAIQSTNQRPLLSSAILSTNQLSLFYSCHSIHQSAASFVFCHSINRSAVSFLLVSFNPSIS